MTKTDSIFVSTAHRKQHVLRSLFQLIYVDVLHNLGSWRWLLVPPIYFIIGVYYTGLLSINYVLQQPRIINGWDVPPAVVSNRNLNVWVVALGFMLLVGDSYLRDRDRNVLALTLSRASSRTEWWLAKIVSIGILALCYVGLMFGAILCGSILKVPPAFTDSPQSLIPTNWNDLWYPRIMTVPMPLFVGLIGFYTAFALWIVGCIVLTVSLLAQRAFVPLVASVGWAALSLSLGPWLSGNRFLISLPYFITYAKHFLPYTPTSLLFFGIVSFSILTIVFALGMWRLRRIDV